MNFSKRKFDKDSLIVVTGGAGFIGSNLVRHLNDAGHENILVVDDLTDGRKFKNLVGCSFGYEDKDQFIEDVLEGHLGFDYLFHLGAISSTTHKNGKELMDQNYQYSIDLIAACRHEGIPVQYASSASVYGNEKDGNEDPLNCYAFSKQMVDNYVRDLLRDDLQDEPHGSQVIGLRYFNVYGPNEEHKDGQSSPIYQFWKQAKTSGVIKVFDVDAKRDFIHVDDVCKVHLYLMRNEFSGIIDVGTSTPESFFDVANVVRTLLWDSHFPSIEKIPFPEHLLGHYQYHTCAANHLEQIGYTDSLLTLDQGAVKYIKELERRASKNSVRK